MDKTPSSCAVDKYMSKISKVLACTKKFKIVVLVAEVWCVNFFFFFFAVLCAWIKMHNIKRPELFRVTFKFSTSLFLASTAAITFNYISLFFRFRPQFWTCDCIFSLCQIDIENTSSDIISLKHCLECVFSGWSRWMCLSEMTLKTLLYCWQYVVDDDKIFEMFSLYLSLNEL